MAVDRVLRGGLPPAWAGQPTHRSSICAPVKVYPRVGGATISGGTLRPFTSGLPPRGRGNPAEADAEACCLGSTPAWAGQPGAKHVLVTLAGVYPRVGGATRRYSAPGSHRLGLPPRGRGNPGLPGG